jgi:hypothetical protein
MRNRIGLQPVAPARPAVAKAASFQASARPHRLQASTIVALDFGDTERT